MCSLESFRHCDQPGLFPEDHLYQPSISNNMTYYIKRILNKKLKYFTSVVIIGFVFYCVHALTNMIPELYQTIYPDHVFKTEHIYEVKSLQNEQTFLGIKTNSTSKIEFNQDVIAEIMNIDGIESSCLSRIFNPCKNTYWGMNLNDSIKNFMHFRMGKNFEEVLDIPVNKYIKSSSHLPNIYIDQNLQSKLTSLGMRNGQYEFGTKKEKFQVMGTFPALGIMNKRRGELMTAISIVTKSDKMLVKFSPKADIEKSKKQIFSFLQKRFNTDQYNFDIYPVSSYNMDSWYEMRNQIISMLVIAVILLVYIMLALLGLYWNETKSRNIEIGLLRAVGFTKVQVFMLFIKEASLISIIAILIVSGILMNIYHTDIDFEFFKSLILQTIIVLGIVWLSIFIPAYKSTKIQPALALADEG
ncbi:ABC transporter permease [Puteibacter caeruleilacunae]|nr:ABC transporter permease [Puteibacter caeruleilacunae]